MRTISSFTFLTINGFFKGDNEDISWHAHAEEGDKYSRTRLESGNILLFGRKTYDLMSSFWPTQMAYNAFPEVAQKLNEAEKIVLSNSISQPTWQNTTVVSGDGVDRIKHLKNTPGKNLSILGSGSIVNQLTEANLIDTYEFLIDPLAIGRGAALFNNLNNRLELELAECNVFKKSGMVLLIYNKKHLIS